MHPQQWHQPCFELCSCLQEHFGFPVGCSAYLTPPNTQGFPPHYDDVEIIVLQVEGTKRWRLYERPDAATAPSPRVTTEFTQAQLGTPTAEIVLALEFVHRHDVIYRDLKPENVLLSAASAAAAWRILARRRISARSAFTTRSRTTLCRICCRAATMAWVLTWRSACRLSSVADVSRVGSRSAEGSKARPPLESVA